MHLIATQSQACISMVALIPTHLVWTHWLEPKTIWEGQWPEILVSLVQNFHGQTRKRWEKTENWLYIRVLAWPGILSPD